MDWQRIVYILPGILLSLTVHEYCHALATWKLGDSTARDQGRVTLNPIRHTDPKGNSPSKTSDPQRRNPPARPARTGPEAEAAVHGKRGRNADNGFVRFEKAFAQALGKLHWALGKGRPSAIGAVSARDLSPLEPHHLAFLFAVIDESRADARNAVKAPEYGLDLPNAGVVVGVLWQ